MKFRNDKFCKYLPILQVIYLFKTEYHTEYDGIIIVEKDIITIY